MTDQKSKPAIVEIDIHQPRALAAGVIHLYMVSISALLSKEDEFASTLDSEEIARASRFINPEHGRQFRCIRGVLRNLVGYYLKMAPSKVGFRYAEFGKPVLQVDVPLHFNLSHSQHMAAFAFCLDQAVGVDIEYMREQKDLLGMLRHVGSPQEQAEIQALSGDDAKQAFYRLWTRKESFIKAVGRGLGMGLRSIHIGSAKNNAALAVTYKGEYVPEWFIQDVSSLRDYKLAICAKYFTEG